MSRTVKLARFGVWCAFTAICGALLIFASAYLYLSPGLPSVDSLRDIRLQTPLRIFSSDGHLIAEFGEKRRAPVQVEDVPEKMIQAFLAAEDDRFYEHQGVDVTGLLRASLQLLATGKIQSGGSTITMQVAKNFFLTREKVFSRKFNEILLALEIEQTLSKDEIIELYLNKIFLGHRSYGVEAAAQTYYGLSIGQLDLSQIAMIAGLPKAPSRYNPLTDSRRALIRRNWILGRMHELNYIDTATHDEAIAKPITARFHGLASELSAPYVAEMVRKEALGRFGQSAYTDGYEIYTTIDSTQQRAANAAIDKGLQSYDERHGYRGPEQRLGEDQALWAQTLSSTPRVGQLNAAIVTAVSDTEASILLRNGTSATIPWEGMSWATPYISVNRVGRKPAKPEDVVTPGDLIRVRKTDDSWRLSQIPEAQAALVALNPNNGGISALVGGFNFQDSKYNRVTQAERQVGSAFKPFIYSTAIHRGLTAATLINDAPVVFSDSQLESYWRPQNDNQKFYGPTRLREGLYRSRNLVSIRLLQRLGIRSTLGYLEELGLPGEKLPDNLSLSLGSAAMTPLELARGYTTIANGGFQITPYIIQRIERLNEVIEEARPAIACRTCSEPEETVTEPESLTFDDSLPADNAETPPAPVLAPRVMDPRVNYIVVDMMKDVIQKGTGRRARALGRKDLAGKTGTTNDQRDVWFSGFHTDLQATVWLGFDQPSTLGRWEYGANTALPMWIDFMKVALADKPETRHPQPDGIVSMKIDSKTGLPTRPRRKWCCL